VQGRLNQRGIRVTITNKNIGYELRCATPIPFDMAYCRDLGYSAIRFLLNGGSGAMVSVQGGRMVPLPFDEIREPETGKTRVRLVNVQSEGFRVAREYMIRLEAEDFADPRQVAKLASAGNLTAQEFSDRFKYLTIKNR
jgi:6-phosphofructokinase